MRIALRLLLCLTSLAVSGCATSRQPPLGAPGISSERRLMLGGVPQTIFIRGRDRANPVLLFLHGGPGFPEMPFSHLNAELEREFTVVHWDQRGAGKSARPAPPSMNVAQFVADTEELTRYLRQTFHQEKIYLAGFSWGSLIGALTVAERPQDYRAYVGISQLVNIAASNRVLYREALARSVSIGNLRVAAQLRALGEPPYGSARDSALAVRLGRSIRPRLPEAMTPWRFLSLGLQSPYYSLGDDWRLLGSFAASSRMLKSAIDARDLYREVPEIDVPVWFLAGRFDPVLSQTLAEDYYRRLRAPRGKHFVWFEHSDHILQLEESTRFRAELHHVLLSTQPR